jgi:hypothetical protein
MESGEDVGRDDSEVGNFDTNLPRCQVLHVDFSLLTLAFFDVVCPVC